MLQASRNHQPKQVIHLFPLTFPGKGKKQQLSSQPRAVAHNHPTTSNALYHQKNDNPLLEIAMFGMLYAVSVRMSSQNTISISIPI